MTLISRFRHPITKINLPSSHNTDIGLIYHSNSCTIAFLLQSSHNLIKFNNGFQGKSTNIYVAKLSGIIYTVYAYCFSMIESVVTFPLNHCSRSEIYNKCPSHQICFISPCVVQSSSMVKRTGTSWDWSSNTFCLEQNKLVN